MLAASDRLQASKTVTAPMDRIRMIFQARHDAQGGAWAEVWHDMAWHTVPKCCCLWPPICDLFGAMNLVWLPKAARLGLLAKCFLGLGQVCLTCGPCAYSLKKSMVGFFAVSCASRDISIRLRPATAGVPCNFRAGMDKKRCWMVCVA